MNKLLITFFIWLNLNKGTCVVNALAARAKRRASSGRGFGARTAAGAPAVTYTYQPDKSPATAAMLQFLRTQKADIDKVEIGYDKETKRRGLFAKKTFGKAGSVLCKIPSDCALALADPQQGDKTETPSTVESGLNFLQMYEQKQQDHQKKQPCWWKPYLDSLPSREQAQSAECSTPNMWTEDEIDLLEFPRIVNSARKRKHEIHKRLEQHQDISKEDLEYATWLVSSRAFPIRIADEKNGSASSAEQPMYDEKGQVISKASSKYIPCLVPFIDMANHHSSQPNAKWTVLDPQKDNAWFALETLRPIPAGKEITLGYGSGIDSSLELLLDYGFVEELQTADNPIDSFMLKKGGDDCIGALDGWTTTLEEDAKVLAMLLDSESEENAILQKILRFRIKLKRAYGSE